MINHLEADVGIQKARGSIVKAEFSKDNKYLVFHLLKEHPFRKSGKEIHEFCVLKCDAR